MSSQCVITLVLLQSKYIITTIRANNCVQIWPRQLLFSWSDDSAQMFFSVGLTHTNTQPWLIRKICSFFALYFNKQKYLLLYKSQVPLLVKMCLHQLLCAEFSLFRVPFQETGQQPGPSNSDQTHGPSPLKLTKQRVLSCLFNLNKSGSVKPVTHGNKPCGVCVA